MGGAAGLLLLEGIVSLGFGKSVVHSMAPTIPKIRLEMLDEERIAAAAKTEGPFSLDADPFVGSRMKGRFAYKFAGATAHTDDDGQRVRAGPPAAPGAPRIVILGDSVAFGFGLEDGETLGDRLESWLSETLAPGAPRPVVSTIACPGWSLENERRYLIDHLPEILPDVILYIASNNDLDDGFEILENGHRVPAPDPAATARLPHCSIAYHYSMAGARAELFPAIPYNPSGYALYTGVTPESRRRYAGAVNGLVDLQGRVSNRGGKLGIVFLQPDPLDRRFAQFLRAGAPALPILTLFDSMRPIDALKDDPHPNAACVRAAAWRVARFLVDQHWVPGAGARALPAEDPNYRGRVAKDPSDAELASERAAWDSIALARLGPRIDFKTGAGWEQIYGGFHADGAFGMDAFCALSAASAKRLVIAFERFTDIGGIYPLAVSVSVDGRELASIPIPPPAAGETPMITKAIDLPDDLAGPGVRDVLLRSSSWVHAKTSGLGRLISIRVASIALEDDPAAHSALPASSR